MRDLFSVSRLRYLNQQTVGQSEICNDKMAVVGSTSFTCEVND